MNAGGCPRYLFWLCVLLLALSLALAVSHLWRDTYIGIDMSLCYITVSPDSLSQSRTRRLIVAVASAA